MLRTHCFRLKPGQDLKNELMAFCRNHQLKAGTLLSGVGSLRQASLRLADGKSAVVLDGPFEIVSLIGTLGMAGVHLHIAVADRQGQVVGGHLMEGSSIHTTAEVVLLEDSDWEFLREADPQTGYKELNPKNIRN